MITKSEILYLCLRFDVWPLITFLLPNYIESVYIESVSVIFFANAALAVILIVVIAITTNVIILTN